MLNPFNYNLNCHESCDNNLLVTINNKKFFYVAQIMNSAELIRYALLLMMLHPQACSSFDIISRNQSITDGDVLVSRGRTFALGFFSLGNSSSRYLGIWYNKISEQTAVWVANRDNPINDTSGILSINNQGNLLLLDHQKTPIWSTNASVSSPSSSMAQLLDSGNLVILESDHSQRVLWQSFDNPSNTMLPNLKLGVNKITGLNRFLTSWKSKDNPGTGTITYKIDPRSSPQLFLNKGQVPLWRVGSWTGQRWSGVPSMTKNYIFTVIFINNQEEVSVMWGIKDPSIITRMVIDETGVVRRLTWHEQSHKWTDFWDAPKEKCDSYGLCGPNGNCDPTVNPAQFECTCLPGFKPKSSYDWFLRDGSGGCVRNQGASLCGNGEGFVKVARVKVPDTSKVLVDASLDLAACEKQCLKNCSCMAYTSADEGRKMGCMTWHGDMVDTRTFPNTGQDLYVRVDAIELAKHSKAKDRLGRKAVVEIVLAAAFVGLILMVVSLVLVLKKRRGKGRPERQLMSFFTNSAAMGNDFNGNRHKADLPFFRLSAIATITKNFSDANKLGEGGFGSVYKGQLENGTEIALKRLAKSSGQGIEEFKNEITLIAKLQHINLVRILGCCVEGEEKILIYEYLPNKSLDFILFDQTKKILLGWGKRYDIICGVGRGLLYLHQDSRLRIIHRDLKASNILLDGSWLPKISDFGMARIFGRDQMEAITNRVVGTYGYMSPEYAMEGLYSTKSDVYSFGILVLELVTGRKNSSFRDSSSANLVGHVWDSWTEGQAMNTVDSSILEEPFLAHDQVMRCIHIALLCVQEHAVDRPTMPVVISMLGSDLPLPAPKQPAFIFKTSDFNEGEISTSGAHYSNEMTDSILLPR